MKRVEILLVIIALLITFSQHIQGKSIDHFAGKWELSVTNTPEGDGKMVINLERLDGKLRGIIMNNGSNKEIQINRVEEKETDITVYFDSDSGYEVYVFIEKVNENQVKGNVMDMFDVTGKRLK